MTTPLVSLLALGVAVCVTLIVWAMRTRRRTAKLRLKRAQYIANYVFPTSLRFKLDQAYSHLSGEQVGTILQGLRVWFQLVAANPSAQLGMPSRAVDTAWHEFVLLTKNYADFCEKHSGNFCTTRRTAPATRRNRTASLAPTGWARGSLAGRHSQAS